MEKEVPEGYELDSAGELVPIVQGTVEAVGTASLALRNPGLAQAIEAAMSKAVEMAYAEGLTDPDEIRERMLEARRVAKDAFNKAG